MKKNGKLNEAAQNALNKVVICENKIKALHYAINGLDRKFELYHEAKLDFSRLHCLLYQELNEAYRVLFMWGVLNKGEALETAKKAALDHYLSEKTNIMNYLNIEGSYPGELENQFRAEIEALRKK